MILTRPLRKPFWLLGSFVSKHRQLILAAAFIGVALFFLTKNLLPLLPKVKPHLKIGLVGQYTFTTLPPEISQTISRGLVKLDPSGAVEPDLAQSWEILEAGRLYRLYLKPDQFWSDGSLIKAKDLNFKIPDVEIKVVSDTVLEFKLKEPYAPFLTVLSQPLFKNQSLGAADYLIKSVKTSGLYLKSLSLIGPKQNLTYRFYPSHQTAWLGFRLGEVDRLSNLFINPVDSRWAKSVKLQEAVNYQQYLAVIFNLNNPYLSQKSLRQALAYATQAKAKSSATRALTPISPNSWAYNKKVKTYDYQPDQAKELFAKFLEEATVSGKLSLTLATSQSFLGQAEAIAASWSQVLPLDVEVKIINQIDPDFEAVLITQEIPPDPDQHSLWHSTQETNITHYSDLKIDKLLEDGRMTDDLDKRKEIYADFQKFLVEDTPAIFLEHPTTYTISRN